MQKSKIEQFLIAKGIAKNSITSFFDLMDLPENALELSVIVPTLPLLIEKIVAIASSYPQAKIDSTWCQIAQEMQALDSEKQVVKTSKLPPLWGEYCEHSIYVAIWATPIITLEQYRAAYLELLAHIMVAASIIRPQIANSAQYQNVLVTAPASVRKIAQQPYLTALHTIPLQCNGSNLIKNITNSQLSDELASVCTLLGYVAGKKAPKRIGLSRTTIHDTKPKFTVLQQDSDEQNCDQAHITIIDQITKNDAEGKALAPGEITYTTPLIQLAESSASNAHQTIVQGVMRAQRAARTAVQYRNQSLPFAWHMLTDSEIHYLWQAITTLNNRNSSDSENTPPAMILALMLLCGLSIQDISKLTIHADKQLPQNPAAGLILINNIWCLINTPYQAANPASDIQQQLVPTIDHLIIILPDALQEMLRQANVVAQDGQIFTIDVDVVSPQVQAIISDINAKYGLRLTTNRISTYLFGAIEQLSGADVATAMLLTGKSDYTGTVVAHYTAQRCSKLNTLYQTVWDKAPTQLNFTALDTDSIINGIVGSSRIARIPVVKNLVAQLRQIAVERKQAAKVDPTIINLVRWHNAYTRYVAIMVAYALGVRAVTSPMPHTCDIDFASGFCTLSDKDNIDGYHTRLIWIAPLCLQQLQTYLLHVRELATKLSILQPNFFCCIKAKRSKNIENQLYFLRSNGEPQEITPKILHNFSDLPTPIILPHNANRHLLRTWLLNKNCPVEIINAYMGHWFAGEEPWSSKSALSPPYYRHILAQHIPAFLDNLGFTYLDKL